MARRGRTKEDFAALAVTGARGVAEWTSTAEIHDQERRWWKIAGGIGAAAVLGLTGLPLVGAPAVLAFEALAAVSAGFAGARLWDLSRMHRRARIRVDDQIDDMIERQETDHLLARVGRLVDLLPPTLKADGKESYRVAARTAIERQRLLGRAADLRAILERSKGEKSLRRLREQLRSTEQDAERMHFKLERLAVALADIVDSADDQDLAHIRSRVEDSEGRLHALVEALTELQQDETVLESERESPPDARARW